jgi:hypothetical protein
MFTLENSFRIQIFVELFLEALPQIIVQTTYNSMIGWTSVAKFSFAMSIMVFIKDIGVITVFFT